MQTHLQKWGNSLGLRIPIKLAKQLHLHQGSVVNLEVHDGKLILEMPKYDLKNMIEAINPKNMHHLLIDDKLQGKEEW